MAGKLEGLEIENENCKVVFGTLQTNMGWMGFYLELNRTNVQMR